MASADACSSQTSEISEKSGPPPEAVDEHLAVGEFIYDPNDSFYMAPAVCRLFHYRHAAIACGIIEVIVLLVTVAAFINLHLQDGITDLWVTLSTVVVLAMAIITTGFMRMGKWIGKVLRRKRLSYRAITIIVIQMYGIATEQPKLLWPQLAFLHFEITLLIIGAIVSITSMSMGIHTTHSLFGLFVSVHRMEENFGPIWPFNMAVLAFFGAALAVWFHIIVRGCYDYLVDKQYFAEIPQAITLAETDDETKKPM